MPGSCHGFARWRAQSALGASGSPSTTRRPRALPADADRGRVARAAGLRPDPPQPRGELGHRRRAWRTSGSISAALVLAVRRSPRPAGAARRDRRRRRRASTRTTCSSRPARSRRCSSSTRRCSRRARTSSSPGPTTPPTSRRRGRSAPTCRSSTSRTRTAGRWTPTGSPRSSGPETRLVSLTTPHNPTGTTLDRATLDAVIALVERHGTARLLVDETYREMTFGEPLAASPRRCSRPGDQRDQPVEDVRPAGHPRRVAA